LRGPVLLAALGLLALDALVVFLLAGGIGQILRRRPQGATAAMLLAAVLMATLTFGSQAFAQQQQAQGDLFGPMINRAITGTPPREQRAQSEPLSSGDADFALKATTETRLAYVITGDAEVDGISKSGLQGLTLYLAQRTALEAGDPVGLDIGKDELAFFPLI
jgi:hypothetical protein